MTAQNVGRFPPRVETEPFGYRSYPVGATSPSTQFYSGQMLMFGKDDGLVKPVSGSAQNGGIVGICDHQDVVVSAAAPLDTVLMRTQYGTFGVKGDTSITTGTLPNTLLFALDDQTCTATQSGLLPVAGRLYKYVPGDPYPVYVHLGQQVSGTLI